jgi:uncharacterized membrane protein YkoI
MSSLVSLRRLALAVALALTATLPVRADDKNKEEAKEEKVPLDKVPKEVLDAFKAKFPGAKLTDASTEVEEGKKIYELAFTYKDHKYEMEVEPNGTIIAIDKQLDEKELPEAVAKTLAEKYPKAKYKMIEEVTKKDKIEYYEIELTTADMKDVEVLVDPSGKITKEEKKEKKEDKKDK